jgi:hypothetical protein
MTIQELLEMCDDGEYIMLHMSAPLSQGYTRRLCGRHGPCGEVICGTPEHQVVRFRSADVIRFIEEHE